MGDYTGRVKRVAGMSTHLHHATPTAPQHAPRVTPPAAAAAVWDPARTRVFAVSVCDYPKGSPAEWPHEAANFSGPPPGRRRYPQGTKGGGLGALWICM